MRADLHTHTVFSDGELIPAELVRRAMVLGHDVIAITDHVDMTNVEFVASNVAKAVELCEDYIKVIPGVEITHVPPSKIDRVARMARAVGAQWIVVHGETVTEPVAPGTNRASVENPEIDVLAHPGFITLEEAQLAKDNGVPRSANVILLGAALKAIGLEYDKIENAIRRVFGRKGESVVEANIKALAIGAKCGE